MDLTDSRNHLSYSCRYNQFNQKSYYELSINLNNEYVPLIVFSSRKHIGLTNFDSQGIGFGVLRFNIIPLKR